MATNRKVIDAKNAKRLKIQQKKKKNRVRASLLIIIIMNEGRNVHDACVISRISNRLTQPEGEIGTGLDSIR
jgi:hypothetical protein